MPVFSGIVLKYMLFREPREIWWSTEDSVIRLDKVTGELIVENVLFPNRSSNHFHYKKYIFAVDHFMLKY